MKLAHRMAWELTRGPIPHGNLVLHHCDNPPCCNPDHLWLGDQTANMRDMVMKGRQHRPRGTLHHKARLTDEAVRTIRRQVAEGEAVAQIARDMGLSWATVGHAASGRSWRHVE